MKEVIGIAIACSLGLIAVLAIFSTLDVGVSRSERTECLEWQDQAATYPSFFLAKWQDDQCRAHGIIINAPVK